MSKKKTISITLLCFVLPLYLILFSCKPNITSGVDVYGKTSENNNKPNIIFIISDDQAWNDYSFLGHPQIETPNIDQLAAEGLTFTRGYDAAPLCSPSLASIISGLHPHQNGVLGNDPIFDFDSSPYKDEKIAWKTRNEKRLSVYRPLIENFKQNPLLTNFLRDEGYRSFQTGKWWLGSWEDGGFDDGMTTGQLADGGRHGDLGLKIGREGLEPMYNFIGEDNEKPFFLWYAPFLPHTPHNPPQDLFEKYMKRTESETLAKYWAMCEWFDNTVGDLLGHIKSRGLEESTMIVYISDNGWIQNPGGKRYMPKSKRTPYEKGARSPVIVKYPEKIRPRMDTSNLVSAIDLVPTVLSYLGLSPTTEMQGIDVTDSIALSKREAIFYADYAHDFYILDDPRKSLQSRIVVQGPWKLIANIRGGNDSEQYELYHTIEDPEESENVASKHPKEVEEMTALLDDWLSLE